MNEKIKLLIKLENTQDVLEENIIGEDVLIYMNADILTYSCFNEFEEDVDYEIVSRKYDRYGSKFTIIIRKLEEMNKKDDKFKVVVVDSNQLENEEIESIAYYKYTYQEIRLILQAGCIEINSNMYEIEDTVYNFEETGLAIVVKNISD